MKPYLFLVVSAFLALFTNINNASAVSVMGLAEFDSAYPAGASTVDTLRVSSLGGVINVSFGGAGTQFLGNSISLHFAGGEVDVWQNEADTGISFVLPTAGWENYIAKVFGPSDGTIVEWNNTLINPGQIGVDSSSFKGQVDILALNPAGAFNIELGRFRSSVPEPATYASMVGLGLLGFAFWRRKQ